MANINAGSVVWNFDVDTKAFNEGLAKAKSDVNSVGDTMKNNSSQAKSWASTLGSSFDSIANGIANVAKVAYASFTAGALGIGVFIKEASDMQSVKASFESMTGSVEEANKVLSQLSRFKIETAFSTNEINAAARTFLGAGLAVNDLGRVMKQVGDVAGATGADLGRLVLPLSQALARGKVQTQDFYQILDSGAGSLGKALREKLAQQGMGDFMKAMEEGKVTAEVLFQVLEEQTRAGGFAFNGAIKQSQTFAGQMSNLKETIIATGLAVLGVDFATGQIDPEGVFAKMSKAVSEATEWLKENRETIERVASVLIDNAVPALAAITAMFVVAKVAALAFAIQTAIATGALSLPFLGIAAAITAIIGVLVFLQVKFNIFGKAAEWVVSTWQTLHRVAVAALQDIANWIGGVVNGAVRIWQTSIEAVKGAITTVRDTAASVFNAIKGWIDDNSTAITNVSIVIGALLLPKLTAIGIEAAKAAAASIASFVKMSASATVEGAKTSAVWVASAARTSFVWVTQTLPKIIAGFVTMSIQATVNAAKVLLAMSTAAIQTGIRWGLMFALYLQGVATMVIQTALAAVRMAASWLLAMGPIGLIIAAVIAIAALIIANWETVKGWLTSFWEWLKGIFTAGIDWIKANWDKILIIFGGPIGAVIALVIKNWDTIKQVTANLVNAIGNFFNNAKDWIIRSFQNVVNWIRGVPGMIMGALGNLGSLLTGAGEALFNGLINGMKNVAGKVKDTAKNIVQGIRNLLPFSPAKEGPFSGRGYTLYSGRALIQGLAQGIKSQEGMLQSTMGGMIDGVSGDVGVMVNGGFEQQDFASAQAPIVNHIGEINIASEADGENWLKRLTRDEEITSQGLTPYAL